MGFEELGDSLEKGVLKFAVKRAVPVLLREGSLACVAACSVRSSCDLVRVRIVVCVHLMVCPVVLLWWLESGSKINRAVRKGSISGVTLVFRDLFVTLNLSVVLSVVRCRFVVQIESCHLKHFI